MIISTFVQAYENIRENFQITFVGIITVCFSLIILGTFSLVYMNLISLTQIFFQQSQYSVFLADNIKPNEKDSLKEYLNAINGVENIKVVSSEQAHQELLKSLGEAGKVLEQMTFHKMPTLIEFDLKRMVHLTPAEIKKIESISGVDEVVYGQETQEQIRTFFNIANFVGIFLIVLFVISISFIIRNSIQIAVRLRIKEIEILKTLGATLHFICWPYVWEGCFIAFFSFIFSLGGIYFVFQFILAGITFNEATYTIRETVEFFPYPYMVICLVSLLVLGAFISYGSTWKLLKQLAT